MSRICRAVHHKNIILKPKWFQSNSLITTFTKSFSNTSSDDTPDEKRFVSDNWVEGERKIQSVEELSDFGQDLLANSLFTGDHMEHNTEEMYGEWADRYENDMGALQFDSLITMPSKVEQYLTETLSNNIIFPEEDGAESSDPDPDNEANILDVGCGTGLLGELLLENTSVINSEEDNSVTLDGMDLTQEMLDILEKERGDLYNEIHQHDITTTPWPFDTDKYDLSVCNGVLVYVKDSECLEEFIRVTKPGGHCLLMLRKDGLEQFSSKIYQMITDNKWKIAEITDTRYNFKAQINNQNKFFVPYNHHIFQVL
eukprot:165775_1